MLAAAKLIAFVATNNPARAKAFYVDVLGIRFVSEDGFALVFDADGTMLRMAIVRKVTIVPYTVLGWNVDDIGAAVRGLAAAGVQFERFPPMEQDELGIWSAPGGAKVAWFKDPDGNLLSVSEH